MALEATELKVRVVLEKGHRATEVVAVNVNAKPGLQVIPGIERNADADRNGDVLFLGHEVDVPQFIVVVNVDEAAAGGQLDLFCGVRDDTIVDDAVRREAKLHRIHPLIRRNDLSQQTSLIYDLADVCEVVGLEAVRGVGVAVVAMERLSHVHDVLIESVLVEQVHGRIIS